MDQAQELDTLMERMVADYVVRNQAANVLKAMLDETDRLYRQHGLNRGSAKRFLESGNLSPVQKAKAEQELEQFLQEVERDIERDLANARSASRESAKPKFRAMRI
jgi:hypothetical protein